MAKGKKTKEQSFKDFASQAPKLSVLTDHPIEVTDAWRDSFELRYRVGPIFDIIRHPDTKMPMTIAIYGDWGMGKTSAMRWLESGLHIWNARAGKKGVTVRPVWFYPWKYDTKEDVRRGLIAEVVLNAIDVKNASTKTVISAAKKFGLFLGKSFLHTLASVKLKADDRAEAELDLAAIKEILGEYQQAAHPEKAFLNEFETTLRDWVKNTVGKDGGKERMVIFIDDLDRCMPDVALQVLESLKLYLNIDNLIFAVGVDKDVIDRLVIEHYRKLGLVTQGMPAMSDDKDSQKKHAELIKEQEEKARQYLCKMFQVEVSLIPSEQQMEALLEEQLSTISYWNKLNARSREVFRAVIAKQAKRNPREIKRIINSAVMGGVGALMLSQDDQQQKLTFAQGLQLFFIERILTEKHTMGTQARSKDGIEFFSLWSEIVRDGRQRDLAFPLTVKDLKSFGGYGPTARTDYPAQYKRIIEHPGFSHLHGLLGDEELGLLMQIEYPSEVAVEVATASGHKSDADSMREAIARGLRKSVKALTIEDVISTTELSLEDTGISDLSPLQRLSRLQTLHLCGTPVTDLGPLGELGALKWLDLKGTRVTGLRPLQGLSNLQYLDLSDTAVTDLSPLRDCEHLETLILSHTQVTNLTALRGLNSLMWLDLEETQIDDLGPLRGLKDLYGLILNGTHVTDLTPLYGLGRLEKLHLAKTQIAEEDIQLLRNERRTRGFSELDVRRRVTGSVDNGGLGQIA